MDNQQFQKPVSNNIQSLRIGLASPDKIKSWSNGEVKKPETFNYRTYKPEKDGLFCERIFGPVKDFECACGKYKKKRYKGMVCERCGVEVTSNRVRRERLGHILLASPVAHIWFTKSIPNRFSALLGISGKEIEKVVYFVSWLVVSIEEEWLKEKLPEIQALVESVLNELEEEKQKLRSMEYINLFDAAKNVTDLPSSKKREITMLAKALEGAAPNAFEGKYDEKLEDVKDILLNQDALKTYMMAEELTDKESGEIYAIPGDKFNFPLVSKLIFLGQYDVPMEDVELEIEAKKRIDWINDQHKALNSALEMLLKIKTLDRLTDQDHEHYNSLRTLCLMKDMGDIDEHIKIGIGAQAIHDSLRGLDLSVMESELTADLEGATSQKRQKLIKRLKVVRAFLSSNNNPSWMILNVLPVLPPELRPMVELEGGRFASSDLNDLYRRVINRNNRLKKLIDIRAPESILRNERRMLQEAVDALIDNGRKGRAAVNVNNRALKSLSDMLKGKQGRFRQNMLGKRVDYSGRSVIVVGPSLRLHQCGLPKYMALELFKPFVLNKLINPDDPNQNIAAARRILERAEDAKVWDALESITRNHPVLLNRAPTLHRLSIQAFEPVLIEGKAIQLHPLVCAAFNADFDGDQMAVHVPLSTAAQAEARLLMLSSNNLLLPADGKPIVAPSHDITLGLYYLTQNRDTLSELLTKIKSDGEAKDGRALTKKCTEDLGSLLDDLDSQLDDLDSQLDDPVSGKIKLKKGKIKLKKLKVEFYGLNDQQWEEKKTKALVEDFECLVPDEVKSWFPAFVSINEALIAYNHGHVKLQEWIRVPIKQAVAYDSDLADPALKTDKLVITTIGRLIFNEKIIEIMSEHYQPDDFPLPFFNYMLDRGATANIIAECFQHAGSHLTVFVADAMKDLGFEMATISGSTIAATDIVIPKEKKEILAVAEKEADAVWSKRKKGVITAIEKDLEVTRIWDQATKVLTKAMSNNFGRFNNVHMMATSGARGKVDQVRQLAAMRGLLVGPSGRVLDFPIKSNFREGLSVFEYFISTHGGRKGLVDTALKTADSGYLTRRLVDVTLDVSVTEEDCKTESSITIEMAPLDSIKKLKKTLLGRVIAQDLLDPKTGEVLANRNEDISHAIADHMFKIKPATIDIRSALTCRTLNGICAKCYGWDLARGKMAEVGDPVGVVAAQSIGEPGTQLTMRTFHTGGIKGRDITQGLPFVEQLFEVRGVKAPSELAAESGKVIEVTEMVYDLITVQSIDGEKVKTYEIIHPYRERLNIHYRSHLAPNDPLDNAKETLADFDGIVTQLFTDTHKTYWKIKVKEKDGTEREYETPHENRSPLVAVGDNVQRGAQLCDGDIDLRKYHTLMGDLATQLFITKTVQDIYESQNVNTNSKHIEVVSKQMIRFSVITDPGDETEYFEGDLLPRNYYRRLVEDAEARSAKPPEATSLLQGISKSSLSTESFLAAASFQETTRVLTEAAIEGKVDMLRGLKENVIIGGLIPVGTGYIGQLQEEKAAEALFGGGTKETEAEPVVDDSQESVF